MKRFFTLVLGALALVVVALLSAFIAMRLAIHGREAVVPPLTGMSVEGATALAESKGIHLSLENSFYSADVPAGRVLAQDPAAGSRVRREWPVRITQSLGAQAVNIPDLTGLDERAAMVGIRRVSLEMGTVAHLAIAGDSDVVLAQTPSANAGGVDGPRISLLVSDPETAQSTAYVMPSLIGLNYMVANSRTASSGLHLVVASEAEQTEVVGATPTTAAGARGGGIIVAQSPQPGRRVVKGETVHVSLGRAAAQVIAGADTQR